MGFPCFLDSSVNSNRATDGYPRIRVLQTPRHLRDVPLDLHHVVQDRGARGRSPRVAAPPRPGRASCSPTRLSPYRCSVHGSTALGNRNARSPSATMSAARASRSLSPRARVKMSARCASQNPASMAMRRESAASAAPRSNAWPAATAGWPHSATTTGAYAATRPLPATADFLRLRY